MANKLILIHKPPYYVTLSGPGPRRAMIADTGFSSPGEATCSGDVRKRMNQPSPRPADSEIKGENMRAVGSIGTH